VCMWVEGGSIRTPPTKILAAMYHIDKPHDVHTLTWLITGNDAISHTRRVIRAFSLARLLTQDLCCFKFTTHCIDPARKLAEGTGVVGGRGSKGCGQY
jgi:hypothetical protein